MMITIMMVTAILGIKMIIMLPLKNNFCTSCSFCSMLSKVQIKSEAASETQPKFTYEKESFYKQKINRTRIKLE